MPFIHPPPLSTMRTQKQPRRSFESEMAVEQELAHAVADRWRMPVQNAWGHQNAGTQGNFFDHRNFPVPPEAHTLPRPIDDRFFQPVEPINHVQPQVQPPAYAVDQYFAAPYAMPPAQAQQVYFGRSEQPIENNAPVMHSRDVYLPQRPITPHDTYRYPAAHAEHIHVVNPVDEAPKEIVSDAFAGWYVDQVIDILVKPGRFRPGVGGQSDETWGVAGREKDGWERVGLAPPDYSKAAWGRMGMTSTPAPAQRRIRHRRLDAEPRDPWNVMWNNSGTRSSTLVTFVNEMLTRMAITPVAVVTAVWFLNGMGLHDGDGHKGTELRQFLRSLPWSDLEGVEKRVALLGLLLAGKWLDDNSFLTKSWSDVTGMSIKQIDTLERCALRDLHYSLHIPVSAWADHVNKLFEAHLIKDGMHEHDKVILGHLDRMVTEGRQTELDDPACRSHHLPRRTSLASADVPAAADQALNRDWGVYSRSYAIEQPTLDADLEAERAVNALVDEAMDEEEYDEEEEDFLDYDGAQRWLPPVSDLRRSTSNSSYGSVDQWRNSVPVQFTTHHNSSATSVISQHMDHVPRNTAFNPAEVYPTPPEQSASYAIHLEPGISIIRPPPQTGHGQMQQFPQVDRKDTKGWAIGKSIW